MVASALASALARISGRVAKRGTTPGGLTAVRKSADEIELVPVTERLKPEDFTESGRYSGQMSGLAGREFHDPIESIASIRETVSSPSKTDLYDVPVFHATKSGKEISEADQIRFVSPDDNADIGFHVGLSPVPSNRIAYDIGFQKHGHGLKGQSNLLLRLRNNTNPARIPDMGEFKNPRVWEEEIEKYMDQIDLDDILPSVGYKDDTLLEDIVATGANYYDDLLSLVQRYVAMMDAPPSPRKIDPQTGLVMSGKPRFNPRLSLQDREEWFDALRKLNEKHGYDSFIYKNTVEGRGEDSLMLMYPDQVKFLTASKFDPNVPQLSKQYGGSVMERNPYNYQPKAI